MPKVDGDLHEEVSHSASEVPDTLRDPLNQELGPFPHQEALGRSMGAFAPRGDRAASGPVAQELASAWGADAFSTLGVAGFASPSPDLHTAAHEATHIAQQEQGLSFYGGTGGSEEQADAVADAVVAGADASPLLQTELGYGGPPPAAVQFKKRKTGPRKRSSGVPLLPNPQSPDQPEGTPSLNGRSLHTPTGDEGDGPVTDARSVREGFKSTDTTTTDQVAPDGHLHRSTETRTVKIEGFALTESRSSKQTEHVERRRNGKREGVGPDGQTPVYIEESQHTSEATSKRGVELTRDGVKLSASGGSSEEHRHDTREWREWSKLPPDERERTPEPARRKSASSTSGELVVDSGGVRSVGATRTTSKDDTEHSTSGSLDLREGKATLGRSRSRTEGEVKSTRSASGTVDLREDSRLEGLSGTVGGGTTRTTDKSKQHSHGGTFSLGGGYSATISKPVKALEEERWTCTWRVSFDASASAGGTMARGPKSAGVSAKLAHVEGKSGTLIFDSLAEAKAAYEQGVGVTDLGFLSQRELRGGETRKSESSTTIGASASATVTVGPVPVSLGGGGSRTTSHGHEETGGEGYVDVEVFASECITANAEIAAILKFEYGYSATDTSKVAVRFHNTTPEGRAALARFRESGTLPPTGYELVKKTVEDKRSETTGLTVLGQGLGSSRSMTASTSRDASGRVVEVSDKGSSGSSLTAGPLGHHKSETSLTATKSLEGGETFKLGSTVDSTWATDANKALARATNTYADPDLPTFGGPKASGTWQVEATLAPQTIDRFLDRVEAGGFRGGFLHGDLLELGAKLSGQSRRTQRRLVAGFVKDKGDRAADEIARIGGQPVEFHAQLEGDLYMQGLARHQKTEQRIRTWRGQVKSTQEPAALGASIGRERKYHMLRRAHLQNEKNYPELPRKQRELEVRRSEAFIDELDRLMLLVKEAERRVRREQAQQHTEDPVVEQCVAPETGTQDPEQSAHERAEQERLERWQANTRENRALAAKKSRLIKWHHRLQTGSWAMKSARSELAYSAFFGLAEGPERASYAEAEKAERDGDAQREKAEAAYVDAIAADGSAAAPLHEGAYWKFSGAIGTYSGGIAIYERLKRKYEKTHPGAFEGYSKSRPPR